jgi:CSLREA domain-containing protein
MRRRYAGLVLESLEDRLAPAVYSVNSLADILNPPAGVVTLRSAIAAANATPGVDTIRFQVTGAIVLNGTMLPEITNDLTITGPGANSLVIDAQGLSRVLRTDAGTMVGISGLALANGNVGAFYGGGAVLNYGVLTMQDDAVLQSYAGSGGGGVFNRGTVTITNCTFSNDSSGPGEFPFAPGGGGLYSETNATVIGSDFANNSAVNGGGAMDCHAGSLMVQGTTLDNNSAFAGSGIFNSGKSEVIDCTISHNTGEGSISNDGMTDVVGCTITQNSADIGGGIVNYDFLGLAKMTITNSTISENSAAMYGGGIFNGSMLTVVDTNVSNNSGQTGGGIFNNSLGSVQVVNSILSGNTSALGGAVENYGSLQLNGSTLAGNSSGQGGGIRNTGGNATLIASTISGNSAEGAGGIENQIGTFGEMPSLTIVNSTIADNVSTVGSGGGIANEGILRLTNSTVSGNSALTAGGIYNAVASPVQADATLLNTIVGDNTRLDGVTPDDIGGFTNLDSASANNLIGPGGSGGLTDGTNGNIVTATVPALGLGLLGSYGGPTQTIDLLTGSPAVDAANATLAPSTDQRGAVRDAKPDIGAYEVAHNIVVTTLTDEDDGTPDPSLGNGTSLREAINFANANPGADTITFAVTGTIQLNSQLPVVSDDLTIAGPGAAKLKIDGQGQNRLMWVGTGAMVGISGLTLTNGHVGAGLGGGGIVNYGTLGMRDDVLTNNYAGFGGGGAFNRGDLTITNCSFANDSVSGDGGGIYSETSLKVIDSTLSGNLAGAGGAIYNNGGTATVDRTKATDNYANYGGCIQNKGMMTVTNSTFSDNGAVFGGALRNFGTVSLTNSTISGNSAQDAGGLLNFGGDLNSGGATLNDCALYGNSGVDRAGGVDNAGVLTVTDCTFSGNAASAGPGGGIYNSGTAGLLNSTVYGNLALSGAGIYTFTNHTYLPGFATLENCIVGGNTRLDGVTPDDIAGMVNVDPASNFNLIGPGGSGGLTSGGNGNVLVSSASALYLGPLADNGGPTPTMALLPGSPAIDGGNPKTLNPPRFDQRGIGFPRVTNGRIDIGAFELQNLSPIANAGGPYAVMEGQSLVLDASKSSDPDGDALTYTWIVNGHRVASDNGGASPNLHLGWSQLQSLGIDGGPTTFSVSVIVDDGFHGSHAVTSPATTLTLLRMAPVAAISGPSLGARGQPLTFTLQATDPTPADRTAAFTFTIDWNDGTTQTLSGLSGVSATHIFVADGAYTADVTATDKDGRTSPVAAHSVAIASVALETNPLDPGKTALVVGGTVGNDCIVLRPEDTKGTIDVSINGVVLGDYVPTGHIEVYAQAGDDVVRLEAGRYRWREIPVIVPAFLFGGDGNDFLDASGSIANNVLVGGAASDTLVAGAGRDILIGGAGTDCLYAGRGDDILIGGTTDFDNNLAALNAIMAEWGRKDENYATRINRLMTGGGHNGSFLLNASTAHNDQAIDRLFGGLGMDWFFASTSGPFEDKILHRRANEVVTAIH